MAAKTKSDAGEALKQLTYLAAALKAPRITEAAARLADWPTTPATPAGPTRSTSPQSWTARSQPATPPAPNYGSVPPGSVPASRSRSSTGTPNQPCVNKSQPWHRVGS